MEDNARINVDIEELYNKLGEMMGDDYATVQLEISSNRFGNELKVSAISFEYDEPIPYGSVGEVEGEI